MSTPSEIIRTQTAIRSSLPRNCSIRFDAGGSSDRISAGCSPGDPLHDRRRRRGRRPGRWPARARPRRACRTSRRWVIRSSIAAMTCGTQPPVGSSAVCQAAASTDFGAGLGQRRGDHLAGAVAPPRHAGVGGEHHRSDHPVGQRLAGSRRCSRRPTAAGRRRSRTATNGIRSPALVRNGVPVSDSRRCTSPNASPTASPQDSPSPAWWISSRTTSVRCCPLRAGGWPVGRRPVRRWST